MAYIHKTPNRPAAAWKGPLPHSLMKKTTYFTRDKMLNFSCKDGEEPDVNGMQLPGSDVLNAVRDLNAMSTEMVPNIIQGLQIFGKKKFIIYFHSAELCENWSKAERPINVLGTLYHQEKAEPLKVETVQRNVKVTIHNAPLDLQEQPILQFLKGFGEVKNLELQNVWHNGPYSKIFTGSKTATLNTINSQAGMPRKRWIAGHHLSFYHRGQVTDWEERRSITNKEYEERKRLRERNENNNPNQIKNIPLNHINQTIIPMTAEQREDYFSYLLNDDLCGTKPVRKCFRKIRTEWWSERSDEIKIQDEEKHSHIEDILDATEDIEELLDEVDARLDELQDVNSQMTYNERQTYFEKLRLLESLDAEARAFPPAKKHLRKEREEWLRHTYVTSLGENPSVMREIDIRIQPARMIERIMDMKEMRRKEITLTKCEMDTFWDMLESSPYKNEIGNYRTINQNTILMERTDDEMMAIRMQNAEEANGKAIEQEKKKRDEEDERREMNERQKEDAQKQEDIRKQHKKDKELEEEQRKEKERKDEEIERQRYFENWKRSEEDKDLSQKAKEMLKSQLGPVEYNKKLSKAEKSLRDIKISTLMNQLRTTKNTPENDIEELTVTKNTQQQKIMELETKTPQPSPKRRLSSPTESPAKNFKSQEKSTPINSLTQTESPEKFSTPEEKNSAKNQKTPEEKIKKQKEKEQCREHHYNTKMDLEAAFKMNNPTVVFKATSVVPTNTKPTPINTRRDKNSPSTTAANKNVKQKRLSIQTPLSQARASVVKRTKIIEEKRTMEKEKDEPDPNKYNDNEETEKKEDQAINTEKLTKWPPEAGEDENLSEHK